MEQQAEAQALVAQGDALLKDGEVAQAAAQYARAVQINPAEVGGHLGLAEANLALGEYSIVYVAARQVQQLAPNSAAAYLAGAILAVVDRRYDIALNDLQRSIDIDPTNGYAHALRGYCLRQLGQNYDASLAEARAARVWGTRNFEHLFPPVAAAQPHPQVAVAPPVTRARTSETAAAPNKWEGGGPSAPPAPRPWDQRSNVERQWVRARFLTRGVPIVTYTLIIVNVMIYLATGLAGGNLFSPGNNILWQLGIEQGNLIFSDPLQAYRLLTAMFLHASIVHVGLNMLSLYFVGVITERIYGHGRFAAIYFISGILAGLANAIIVPSVPALGASGAIFGIFGAFGAFAILQRRSLGPAGGAVIGQWLFWLVINLVISVSDPQIALYDHLGGLIVGFILGVIAMQSMRPRGVRRV